MTTNYNVKLATSNQIVARNAGQTHVVEGSTVEYVGHFDAHHIHYQKYTKNHGKLNDRPYVVAATGRGYATLANAVRALFKNGFTPL